MDIEQLKTVLTNDYGFSIIKEDYREYITKQIDYNGIKLLKIIPNYYLNNKPVLYRFKMYDDNGFQDIYFGKISSLSFLKDLLDNINAL
jgi:hypothetical protein